MYKTTEIYRDINNEKKELNTKNYFFLKIFILLLLITVIYVYSNILVCTLVLILLTGVFFIYSITRIVVSEIISGSKRKYSYHHY